jgi:hypothetical protein
MAGKIEYIKNGELTEEAHLTPDLIKRCTFNVGAPSAIKINDDEAGTNKPKNVPAVQYYQRFIEIGYPNGEKSASCILPGCVIHHDVHDYYGKPSIYLGVPQALVAQLKLKLSATGHSPQFQDKRILSDAKFWWNRVSFVEAVEGKEYIRTYDDDGEVFYAGFADLFADYPTSMLANVTCTMKLKGEAPAGQPLKGNEEWRAGIQVAMITPYDATQVDAPSSGTGQRSIAGKKDKVKPGLAKFKVAQ